LILLKYRYCISFTNLCNNYSSLNASEDAVKYISRKPLVNDCSRNPHPMRKQLVRYIYSLMKCRCNYMLPTYIP